MLSSHHAIRGALFTVLASGLWASACASSAATGSVDQDCYPNGTCNETLTCQAGKCVAGAGGQTSGASSTGHTTGSTSSSGPTTSSSTTSGTGGAVSSTGTGGQSVSASSTSGVGGAGPANGPPKILVFGTDTTSITAGESVTFTAVVTDPNGIGDVIGGTLSDGIGDLYGAFATSAQEGAYELIVPWGEINQMQAINLATGATTQRNFVAEFFDQEGHTVQKSILITLGCKAIAACDGVCIDVSQDSNNCGACGTVCAGGVPCFKNTCAALSGCNLSAVGTCAGECAAAGKTCADKCGPANTNGAVGYSANGCGGNATNLLCATAVNAYPTTKCCCF